MVKLKFRYIGFIILIVILCGCRKSTKKVSQIILSQNDVEILVEEEKYINAEVIPNDAENKVVIWTSSNPEIVDIINGKITGLSPGKAIISAKVGKKIATCMVSVNKATYTVTFNSNGGSKINAVIVEDGDQIFRPNHPQKAGHIFDGWYVDNKLRFEFNFNTEITESITIYAKWIPNTHYITYITNSNTKMDKQVITYNQYAKAPFDPIKEGHDFCGWYLEETLQTQFNFSLTTIHSDLTLHAKWQKKIFQVTFVCNNDEAEKLINYEWNSLISKPNDPQKKGHTFVAWYMDPNFNDVYSFKYSKARSNITLYAKWKVNSLTITYHNTDESEVSSEKIEWNTCPLFPINPEKAGHNFIGWYLDNDFTTEYKFDEVITTDLDLYACWKINEFNVIYDSQGGSEVANITVNWNSIVYKPENPVKRGYVFVEWNNENQLAHDFTIPVTKDITLYAVWGEDPNIKKVDFLLAGGRWLPDSFSGFINESPLSSFALGAYNVKFYDENRHYETKLMLYDKNVDSELLTNSADSLKLGINYHLDGYYYIEEKVQKLKEYDFANYDYTLICYDRFTDGYNFINNIDLGSIITFTDLTVGLSNGLVNVYCDNVTIYHNSGLYKITDKLPSPVKDNYNFVGWYDVLTNEVITSINSNMNVRAKWELK